MNDFPTKAEPSVPIEARLQFMNPIRKYRREAKHKKNTELFSGGHDGTNADNEAESVTSNTDTSYVVISRMSEIMLLAVIVIQTEFLPCIEDKRWKSYRHCLKPKISCFIVFDE